MNLHCWQTYIECRFEIEFKYHSPYIDILIQCTQFVVGSVVDQLSESLHLQLAHVIAPAQHGNVLWEDIDLCAGFRF
jgi:hypothetical protein